MRKFALAIPTRWYLKTLKFAILPTRNIKFTSTPNTKPQREPMDYRLRWVPNANFSLWPRTFCVVYPVVFFALGTQHECCS